MTGNKITAVRQAVRTRSSAGGDVGLPPGVRAAALAVLCGVTSAPELLPDPIKHIGQVLPPGAGANLLRSTAYFDGHGAAGHLAVLITWAVVGRAVIVSCQHTFIRFAAHPAPRSGPAPSAWPTTTSTSRGGSHATL